jgi:hypothetical protein
MLILGREYLLKIKLKAATLFWILAFNLLKRSLSYSMITKHI